MPDKQKRFWITLSLINLCVVALFGVLLRSKILFPIPFIDYRNILSAHSHFAFTGWAGLSLIALFVYEMLPDTRSQKGIYRWILIGIEVSALGMAITFPVWGYTAPAIVFSSLYIVVSAVLAPVFIKHLLQHAVHKTVRLLSISALASLLLSAIGPVLLVYILVTQSGNSVLYRSSVYTFLHFQYNGFFSLAVFALLLHHVLRCGLPLHKQARRFSLLLCLSVVPSLALSLLWHNSVLLYVVAAVGCVLMLLSLFYFILWRNDLKKTALFSEPLARLLWLLAAVSFALKMLLSIGTIIPALGQAVYGDRPVIIGFLHLVFLGFLTFFILALLVEHGYFKKLGKTVTYPFAVFAFGIIANEALLMLQGLGNLFKTTTSMFNWLLWGVSILLFAGAVLLVVARLRSTGVRRIE